MISNMVHEFFPSEPRWYRAAKTAREIAEENKRSAARVQGGLAIAGGLVLILSATPVTSAIGAVSVFGGVVRIVSS